MSVMIIQKETFERVGKFLKAWTGISDDRLIETLTSWRELNRMNYQMRYNAEAPTVTFDISDIRDTALIAPEQMFKSLDFIYYQCVDYGGKIDPKAMLKIERYKEELKKSFKINPTLLDYCAWG